MSSGVTARKLSVKFISFLLIEFILNNKNNSNLKKIVTSSDISHTSLGASRNLPVLAHQTGQEETAVFWMSTGCPVGGGKAIERPTGTALAWPERNSKQSHSTFDVRRFRFEWYMCARHWYTFCGVFEILHSDWKIEMVRSLAQWTKTLSFPARISPNNKSSKESVNISQGSPTVTPTPSNNSLGPVCKNNEINNMMNMNNCSSLTEVNQVSLCWKFRSKYK